LTIGFLASAQPLRTATVRSVRPFSNDFLASLTEMLQRQNVAVGTSEAPVALIDVDFVSGEIIIESPVRELTIRRTMMASDSPAVRMEHAASVVAAAVDVLVHMEAPRQPIPIPRAASPSDGAPPERRGRPLDVIGLDLGLGVGVRSSASTPPIDMTTAFHALVTKPLGPVLSGVSIWGAYQPVLDVSGMGSRFRTSTLALRMMLQAEVLRFRFGRIELGIGGGLDRSETFAFVFREQLMLVPLNVALTPIISALTTYRLPVTDASHVFVTGLLEADVSLPIPVSGPRVPIAQNSVFRPTVMIGLSLAPFSALPRDGTR
jgi:hypothetical protein